MSKSYRSLPPSLRALFQDCGGGHVWSCYMEVRLYKSQVPVDADEVEWLEDESNFQVLAHHDFYPEGVKITDYTSSLANFISVLAKDTIALGLGESWSDSPQDFGSLLIDDDYSFGLGTQLAFFLKEQVKGTSLEKAQNKWLKKVNRLLG